MTWQAIALTVVLDLLAAPAASLESVAIRESDSPEGRDVGASCPLEESLDAACDNYRWYNLCSGYIWVYSGWEAGEGVGVLFGGAEQPCVQNNCETTRMITYFRDVQPGYGQTVDLFLHDDCDLDGCPDDAEIVFEELDVDPGLRWNCSEIGPYCSVGFTTAGCFQFLIVRQVHDGGAGPSFATDGPGLAGCLPDGESVRSYYYGVNGAACVPWVGPTGRHDNFLVWLVMGDRGSPLATESTSWGGIKALFR